MTILRSFLLIFLSAFTLFVSGCGKSSEDSQGKQNPVPPPVSIVGDLPLLQVTPGKEATGSQGSSDTAGIVVTSSQNVVTVTIKTHMQGQVFGHSLYVAYDPAELEFMDCQSGGFLGGGTTFLVLPMDSNKGAADLAFTNWQKSVYPKAVMVSESRSGWNTPGATGNGDLVVLRFNVITTDKTELLFAESLIFEKMYIDDLPKGKDMNIPRYIQFAL